MCTHTVREEPVYLPAAYLHMVLNNGLDEQLKLVSIPCFVSQQPTQQFCVHRCA